MASDRLAGTLMSAGAALALIGTSLSVPSFFPFGLLPFSLLSWVSFGLILMFGVKVVHHREEGPTLAAATFWFAVIGALPFLWVRWFAFWLGIGYLPGFVLGLSGTALAIAGAGLKSTQWQPMLARGPHPRLFERAAWLLGAGSFALLVAAIPIYPRPASADWSDWMWRTVLVVAGLWLHLLAWITLFGATADGFGMGTASRTPNRGRLAWTVSVIGFIVALFTVGSLPPFSWSWFLFPFLAPLFFPYHPAVFAPVVLAHGFIFRDRSRFLGERSARIVVRAGVFALTAAATVGLVGLSALLAEIRLPSEVYWWIFLPFPAGSTAIGYGLIFYGWRRGTRAVQEGLSAPLDIRPVATR